MTTPADIASSVDVRHGREDGGRQTGCTVTSSRIPASAKGERQTSAISSPDGLFPSYIRHIVIPEAGPGRSEGAEGSKGATCREVGG